MKENIKKLKIKQSYICLVIIFEIIFVNYSAAIFAAESYGNNNLITLENSKVKLQFSKTNGNLVEYVDKKSKFNMLSTPNNTNKLYRLETVDVLGNKRTFNNNDANEIIISLKKTKKIAY